MTKNEGMWHGIYPALLTPFKENDEIDFDMFIKNMKAQVDAGIKGVIIGGSLGEASTLDDDEIFDLAQSAKDHFPDVPVLVNLAESSTRNAIKFVRRAEKNGLDGIMLLPPLLYKASDKEVVHYFGTVASASSLPILIYNNPVDYRIHVTVPMFEELEKYDTIQAVKESTRDLTNVTRMINRFGDRFKILGGVDTIALETQLMGGHGSVAGLVNAFPRETVAIYRLAEEGRIPEALEIYRWFMPLLELDIRPKLVQYIKLAATAEGISTPHVRLPRMPLDEDERKIIQKIIDDGIKSRPRLPSFEKKSVGILEN